VTVRSFRPLSWVLLACLAAVAVFGWLSYVGNGMAYSDLMGLPGRDQQLAALRERAAVGLAMAVSAEGLLVVAITWACSVAVTRVWIRLLVTLTMAVAVDVVTYAVVRSL
jgi:hypothetical protein